MSGFRWKREFDNAAVAHFNSHLPLQSAASTVIYLVLQFINLIYDETELLGFTALALPAGKYLTAACGLYSKREQQDIKSFPRTGDPSQQVMENFVLQKHIRIQKQILEVRWRGAGLPVPPLSDLPVQHVQKKCPGGVFPGAERTHTEDPGPPPGGCLRWCEQEQQQCQRAAGSRHRNFAFPTPG